MDAFAPSSPSSQCSDLGAGAGAGVATTASTTMLVATTLAVALPLLYLAKKYLWPLWDPVLPSPLRTTLPRLSEADVAALAYHTDYFPGARDVETPVSACRLNGSSFPPFASSFLAWIPLLSVQLAKGAAHLQRRGERPRGGADQDRGAEGRGRFHG